MDEYIDFIHFQINSKGIAEEKQEMAKSEKQSCRDAGKEKRSPLGQRGQSGKDARTGKGHLYRERAGKNVGKPGSREVGKIPPPRSAVFYCYHLKGMLY